ncbi:MAG: hypothetical protein QNJ55_05695 [Xenococcus sp. MO_188.B8]|nr:hypothetical protein [Xenococcus sp. MO_188.B8]
MTAECTQPSEQTPRPNPKGYRSAYRRKTHSGGQHSGETPELRPQNAAQERLRCKTTDSRGITTGLLEKLVREKLKT